MKIETGAKTLRELVTWLDTVTGSQGDYGILDLPIQLYDEELGVTDWRGVLLLDNNYVVFTSEWTDEEQQAYIEQLRRRENVIRKTHWNRPEVLEAKEKGLLP